MTKPQTLARVENLKGETGHSPIVLWAAVFNKYRFEIRASALMVWGRSVP